MWVDSLAASISGQVWSDHQTLTSYKACRKFLETEDLQKLASDLNTFYNRFGTDPVSLHQLSVSLWIFCYPALLVLGTFGNVISIVIMRRMMTRESTINLFFIALAVGDLMALYSGIPMKWITIAFGVSIINIWPAVYFPSLIIYLSSGGFVGWVLVCMTLQRAFSVAWPHHVNRVFTRGRIVNAIAGVALVQLLLYIHHLYCVYETTTGNMTGIQCIRMSFSEYVWFLDNVFIYIAMAVNSLLPFVCLVAGNGVLVFTLIMSVGEARRNTASGNVHASLKRQKDANSVTVTIIIVSLTFIVLTLPIFIYGDLYQFKDQSKMSAQQRAEVFLFYTISSLLASTNSSINFYLYCLTGRRFREEFVKGSNEL
ncbi:galanin-like G-protein coupled receptor npr-9 [Babylonia areolata]|uniref:galanin-like G-protein coupled receptor npr-9 n=1 Tax=Babylonia areolata TaxID=304850 RepID=UPI003FD3122C